MMGKSVAARIVKLEARRPRSNEILLVWRRPDADVKSAARAVKFATGDRVICLEWFGEGPLPEPKWYRERLSSELGAAENEYLTRSLERVQQNRPRDPGFAEHPPVSANRARELTDNDLLHMAFGVAT
ncbi:hypothetical protein GPL17_18755 [Bradyrhizobium yuanmingense]|uniref:hypothetical protein n=1 Tax=Bradyrhizobium yuanmingense TaxID=108015 RepID=UPI0012F74178|nr:hypothetical protein [Bradyrhizobium yuanmingense]MVT52524.1 hypothetical protein [Bradyrhizobium yuanmingense]